MTSQTADQCLLKASAISATPARCIAHPLNPRSEAHLRQLSEPTGMSRVVVTLARVPAGKESFAYHRHLGAEEFLYILSGRGMAEIEDKVIEVGPGDFLGFAAPSPGHHLTNPFDEDLVYLMGGERPSLDVVEFAKAGKHMIFTAQSIDMVDSKALKPMTWQDWLKK